MNVEEFRKDLLEEVKAKAATDGDGSTVAFTELVTDYLIDAEVLSDYVPAFFMGSGKNNRKIRVDGYVLDEFDMTLNLIITDYTGNEERETITKTIVNAQFDKLRYFIEETYSSKLHKLVEISTPVSDLIEFMRFHKDRIRKYRLILLVDGVMSSRITEINSADLFGVPSECQIWDISRIFNVCTSDLGRQNIEIDFKEFTQGKGIPCLIANTTNNDDYKSYLCIIPGTVIADIYDKYGSRLLEGNVRSFLSTKVAVNKNIKTTILHIPQNFFAYNNGIAATAMDLRIESDENNHYIAYAKDFQIINGGQTTASLSNTRFKDKADLSKVYVQMKLTEIDSDDDEANDLIRNISRSSNSQNKVSDADFFATHPFHIRIEKLSRRIFAPATGGAQYDTKWFYERARGQYLQAQMRMTNAEKKTFKAQHPKKQVITKTDLAKVRNTWEGMPQIVSKGAQTNFVKFAEVVDKEWEKSDKKYNEKYFKDTVSLFILFKQTESIVSQQPWYQNAYRANIVTYSIALLHKLIIAQFDHMDLDLQRIWLKQEIPQIVSEVLITITKYVYDNITNPGSTANVTQWCKRDACWENILNGQEVALPRKVEMVLVSRAENRERELEAKNEQKIISEIDAQKLIFEKGKQYWEAVQKFILIRHCKVTEFQLKSLKYAINIPTTMPSGKQSQQLLVLEQEAIANGFKY